MITVSLKRRNEASVLTIKDALQAAMIDLERCCIFVALNNGNYPGYISDCANCQCRQGCRDISRAYLYTIEHN